KINSLKGDAVAFNIAVGDIISYIGVDRFQEIIHQGYGCGSVHIVIAINQNIFIVLNGFPDYVDGFVHILHQKGVVEVFQFGSEKILGRVIGFNSSLRQDYGQWERQFDFVEEFTQNRDFGFRFEYSLAVHFGEIISPKIRFYFLLASFTYFSSAIVIEGVSGVGTSISIRSPSSFAA